MALRLWQRLLSVGWSLVVVNVVCNTSGVILFKMAMLRTSPPASSATGLEAVWHRLAGLLASPLAWVGGLLFFSAPIFYAAALSRIEVSTAYPLQVGLTSCLVLILSLALFGERMTWLKAAGMILIFISVFLLREK